VIGVVQHESVITTGTYVAVLDETKRIAIRDRYSIGTFAHIGSALELGVPRGRRVGDIDAPARCEICPVNGFSLPQNESSSVFLLSYQI
jgi:hypothetical protein